MIAPRWRRPPEPEGGLVRPGLREAVSHILFCLRETWAAAPWVVALSFAGAAVSSQFAVAASYLQGLLVDKAIAVVDAGARVGVLAAPLVLRLLLELVQAGYGWVSNIGRVYLQTRVTNTLRLKLLDRISRLDIALIETPAVQDALEYAERNLPMVAFTPNMVTSLLRTSLTMVTSLAIIAAFDWRAAAAAGLVCIPLGILFARMGRSRLWHELRSTPESRKLQYTSSLLRSPPSIREMRILGFREYLLERVRSVQDLLWQRESQMLSTNQRREFAAGLSVSLASIAGIVFVLMALVDRRITVGQLVFFMSLVVANIRRMESDTSTVTGAYESAARVGGFRRVLQMKPAIRWPEDGPGLDAQKPPGIEFRNVSFTYPRTNVQALVDVSFTLKPGQRATLVGENGAGKTTLVKLLLRLYDPDEGEVLVNGRDIREYNLERLWDKVTYLAQDFVRYELTARENIAFGRIALLRDDARLLTAADQGGIRRKIESLPDGLDTELGTFFGKAHPLSGGEWQRLALARVFVRDAPLTVLDEPTTSLDAFQESEILERAMDSIAGKTAVVVSHRLATARMADVILVMKGGRLVEHGTHEELLAEKGTYAEMFEKQAKWYREARKSRADAR